MLKFIECPMPAGGGGYTNQGMNWIYIYSQTSITLKDAGGNVVEMDTAPCWLPPAFNINTGTVGDILLGLQGTTGDPSEFAGFLSSAGGGAGVLVGNGLIADAVTGAVEVSGNWTTWSQVYNGKTLATAPYGVVIHNDGTALVLESGGNVFFIDVAGNTVNSGKLSGSAGLNTGSSLPTAALDTYYANISFTSCQIFKRNVFLFAFSTTMASPAKIYMSASGRYILILDSTTGYELWKGA